MEGDGLNSFNPEKIKALKNLIDEQLRSQNVYGQIRKILSDYLEQEHIDVSSEEKVLNVLQERGIIDSIIESLNGQPNLASVYDEKKKHTPARLTPYSTAHNRAPTKSTRYLHVKLLGGKAFLDNPNVENNNSSSNAKLVACLHFQNQRFRSTPVTYSSDPAFDDDFIIELEAPRLPHGYSLRDQPPGSFSQLLLIDSPIHIVVVKIDHDNSSHLVGSHSFEWRKVLKNGKLLVSVELGGGRELNVPVGVLDIRLEILPNSTAPPTSASGSASTDFISEVEIINQFNMEKTREIHAEREFYLYTKQWWQEYLQIRASHNLRMIKIYAQSEDGATRPVTSFVNPIIADRLLDNPRQAARFVSLLGFEKEETVGKQQKQEIWQSMHTFLCKGKGPCESHALLLCSLLLGFGLDAYVCVGTDNNGAHVWVMTRDKDTNNVVFWESLTGARYPNTSTGHLAGTVGGRPAPPLRHNYSTIGCVFNHESFYANIQPDDSVERCLFDLENEQHWKSMSRMKLSLVKRLPPVPICPPSIDSIAMEIKLEEALRAQVSETRRGLGLGTQWDPEMGYLLTPALSAYEMERLTGSHIDTYDFTLGLKSAVPEGHTVKGFPIQFSHFSSRRMMTALLRSKVCMDIIESVGDMVRFGIRVRIYKYPEDVCAVWVMLAVKYRSTEQ